MKLTQIKEEKPFNWIKGFEGIYLINEDKVIKKARIIAIHNTKKEVHEAIYIKPYKNEDGNLVVSLRDSKDFNKEYLIKDLIPIKYKRVNEERKNTNIK